LLVQNRGLIAAPNRTLLIAYPGGAASGSIGDWESAIMTGEQPPLLVHLLLHPHRNGGNASGRIGETEECD